MPQTTLYPADQIQVPPNRQRTQSAEQHVKELAESIKRDGLLHAIAITPDGLLIAGFCRLSAVKMIEDAFLYGDQWVPAGQIPVVTLSGRSDPVLYRIEAEENLRRKNLTPMEEATAISNLHKMFQEEHGPDWTRLDTGRELAKMQDKDVSDSPMVQDVSNAILLDSFAHDPDIANAATKQEAIRRARKKLEQTFRSALGDSVILTKGETRIIQGDFRQVLPQLGGDFSGAIVDPPYGVDADDFSEQALVGGHKYEDSIEGAIALWKDLFGLLSSATRSDAHLYMFHDVRHFSTLADIGRACGWTVRVNPLIWHKPNVGHAPEPGFFLRRYEGILFARKGSRKLRRSVSDVLTVNAETNKTHAAQKPTELYRLLLDASFLPGEKVIDPCCGSGTIFRAARATRMHAVGIDSSPESINLSKLAMEEA